MLSWYLNGVPVDSLARSCAAQFMDLCFCSTGRMIIWVLNLLPGAELKAKLPSMPRLTSLPLGPCASGRAARVAWPPRCPLQSFWTTGRLGR